MSCGRVEGILGVRQVWLTFQFCHILTSSVTVARRLNLSELPLLIGKAKAVHLEFDQ